MPTNIPPANGWPKDPETWNKPEVRGTFSSKYGDLADWKSQGTGEPMRASPGHLHRANPTKYPRYPRAFYCKLWQNNKYSPGSEWSEFDLYDIGAQRNHAKVELYVSWPSGQKVVIDNGSTDPNSATGLPSNGYILLQEAQYGENGAHGEPYRPQVLRFTGPWCELRIYRDAASTSSSHSSSKKKRLDDGDDDGSPPPPDPGDDGSEISTRNVNLSKQVKKLSALITKAKKGNRRTGIK